MSETSPALPDPTSNLPADPSLQPLSAQELLSIPTQDITDEQLTLILKDLRKKREAFLTGVRDTSSAAKKPAAAKVTAEQKKENAQLLLANLGISLPPAKKG